MSTENGKLLLLNTKGRRMNSPNMQAMAFYASRHTDQLCVDIHLANLAKLGKVGKKQENALVRGMLADYDWIYSIDASIPGRIAPEEMANRRILALEPLEAVFAKLNELNVVQPFEPESLAELPEAEPTESILGYGDCRNYTHIVTASPFFTAAMRKIYAKEGIRYLDGIGLPGGAYLRNPEIVLRKRGNLETLYSGIQGKKILSILTSADRPDSIRTIINNLDLKKFLDALPEDWILVTNMQELSDRADDLSSRYAKKFVFIPRKMVNGYDLIYFTDVLISDLSNYLCMFAHTGRPFYAIEYLRNSKFMEYMRRVHPSLVAEDLMALTGDDISSLFTEEHARFCRLYTREPGEIPCRQIFAALGQKETGTEETAEAEGER